MRKASPAIEAVRNFIMQVEVVDSIIEEEILAEDPHHTDEEFEAEEDLIRAKLLRRGPPPKSWDQTQMQFFNAAEHKAEIMALAQGLTMEEVLNFYGITSGILPDYDEFFFEVTYIRGRMKAKQEAVQSLFDNMKVAKGGIGTQASLAYLTRFADSFKGEVNGSDGTPRAIKIEVVE
jgi:hypothetical protein